MILYPSHIDDPDTEAHLAAQVDRMQRLWLTWQRAQGYAPDSQRYAAFLSALKACEDHGDLLPVDTTCTECGGSGWLLQHDENYIPCSCAPDPDPDYDIYGRDCDGYRRDEAHCMHGRRGECAACDELYRLPF